MPSINEVCFSMSAFNLAAIFEFFFSPLYLRECNVLLKRSYFVVVELRLNSNSSSFFIFYTSLSFVVYLSRRSISEGFHKRSGQAVGGYLPIYDIDGRWLLQVHTGDILPAKKNFNWFSSIPHLFVLFSAAVYILYGFILC